ncbi:polygalacturonase QRT3-like [Magnolia sinica]|uniref:polygalacturonase QRT3-like n=1 Tax=Magnolia sinica TaxID=86752 RepID=UPI00265835E6|nr:polygalacturonase QRT3-like [Magnolia sinica]
MAWNGMAVFVFLGLVCLINIIHSHAYEDNSNVAHHFFSSYHDRMVRIESIKASLLSKNGISLPPSPSPSPTPTSPPTMSHSPRVYHVTAYGADPTGEMDSTDAILSAISDAFHAPGEDRVLMPGIRDLGGAEVHLQGGAYKISRPLRLPASGGGNFMIHGGSLRASDDFPTDRHLIELWPSSSSKLTSVEKEEADGPTLEQSAAVESFSSSYEYIKLKDLLLDSNYRGGGISVINSLRTSIQNCYITHFTSDGILVQGGHETFIKDSFLGQHITAGGDPGEKNFSGIAINLMGNDNAVTDVVIFSASIGVLVVGQANILTGVHCYNKATGFGGTGIYLRLPDVNQTQTRIVNCYLDYTGIVAEDPVQLHVSGSFFLGNAYVALKSIKGVIRGLNIVDNMFSGDGSGVDIVKLDQSNGPFTTVDQVVVDRNDVQGMGLRSTVGRASVDGSASRWAVDFSRVLLFPNLIRHVQYSFQVGDGSFPNHALRNVSGNRVVVESDVPVDANVYVWVDQNTGSVR